MTTHSFNTVIKIGDGVEGGTAGWPTDLTDPSTGDPSNGFTEILDPKDIDGPNLSADDEEITAHQSTGKDKSYIQGLRDKGEITFDVNLDPTAATHNSATGLLADYRNGVNRRDYVLVPASDSGDAADCIFFQGYVKNFGNSHPVAGVQTASVTIKVTGDIALP